MSRVSIRHTAAFTAAAVGVSLFVLAPVEMLPASAQTQTGVPISEVGALQANGYQQAHETAWANYGAARQEAAAKETALERKRAADAALAARKAAEAAAAEAARKAAEEKARAEAARKAAQEKARAEAARKAAADRAARAAARAIPAGSARAIGRDLAAARGWTGQQWVCLDKLFTRESNWRTKAANASGAYGIPQALPGSKMASAGADWRTNPATQIKWGLNYIKGRYGTPCGAWSAFNSKGWY